MTKVKEESKKVGLKLNIQKTNIMASGPITSWQIDGETMEIVRDFILGGSKITANGDCSHEIKRCLLLGRKVMTNLGSIFGEGNGTPLQYSCLENTVDGGAWWAAVHGVTQSGTRLNDLAAAAAESIFKSRDITLPTKVRLVKAMVFPVVMYGCESWTVKKAECQIIDAIELWCCRRLFRVPWTARRSNQSILKEMSPGISLEEMMLKLKLQYFGHQM